MTTPLGSKVDLEENLKFDLTRDASLRLTLAPKFDLEVELEVELGLTDPAVRLEPQRCCARLLPRRCRALIIELSVTNEGRA